jgi:Flp pilus assembly protein TadG
VTAPAGIDRRGRHEGRGPRRRDDDRGSAGAELIVMSVVFAAFVSAVVFVGRVNVGSAHVEAAARSAARTISIDRDPASAVAAARAEAADIAGVGTAMCTSMDFSHTLSETEVTVEVTCTVDLSEALPIGVPGTMQRSGDATEAIDQYREGAAP